MLRQQTPHTTTGPRFHFGFNRQTYNEALKHCTTTFPICSSNISFCNYIYSTSAQKPTSSSIFYPLKKWST